MHPGDTEDTKKPPSSTQKAPKRHPVVPRRRPRDAQKNPGAPLMHPGASQRHPKDAQKTPRKPAGTPKGHPRGTLETRVVPKRHFHGHQEATQSTQGATRDAQDTPDPRPNDFSSIFARVKLKNNDSTAEWRRRHSSTTTPAHKTDWKKVNDNNGAHPGS